MKKSQRQNSPKWNAIKIPLIYFIVGIIWILVSDRLLGTYITNSQFLTGMASLKGSLFVIITSILIYVLLYRQLVSMEHSKETLKEGESRYEQLYSSMNEGVALHNLIFDNKGVAVDYIIIDVNNAYENIIGVKKEKILDKKASEIYGTGKPPYIDIYAKVANTGVSDSFETYFEPMDKHFFISVFCPKKGHFATVFEDITERKKAEEALKESEAYYKTIFGNTGTATVIIEEDTTISLVNSEFESLSGYFKEEVEGKMRWMDFVVDKEDIKRMEKYNKVFKPEDVPRNYEFKFFNKIGEVKDVFITVALIPGTKKRLVSLLDITERKQSRIVLKKSLKEKELLLREVHHRVKNNLQIMSSLLNLQSGNIEDESVVEIFKDSQARIKSMALIHGKLYQSENLVSINFGEYIRSLVLNLLGTYASYGGITPKIETSDILFDIDTAIPCGLIVNELVMNSIKHAFPSLTEDKSASIPKEEYEIHIELYREKDHFKLIVGDNGMGIPEDLDISKAETLGLQLVDNLVSQLDGEIEINRINGTEFTITFKELKYKERV
ncbi:MAG: PAS domain S-box protein [Methanobacterium sp.]|uniref:sensor histidine kinase n=1 Tax=Methanobacterium sp. TaxID=2164 RepID=UPI003D659642|nr:PAS domain S-box protein [Methanobacterium sp.]